MKNFKIQKKTLSTGLRTILLPRSDGESVTFMVLVGVGSRYETPRQNGLSHFLEHMFFKGTETRPTTKEIVEAIDNVGGEFNAFTGEEYTGYYVKVATDNLERGADVISDILLRPLFPKEEIERERGVIIEEIRMYTDMPMRHIGHLWQTALFGDHPLGRRIDGLEETVSSFKRQHFLKYTETHYHSENAVVIVAGRFEPARVQRMLGQLFKDLPKGAETTPKAAPAAAPKQAFVSEYRKHLDQTHMIVGASGVSLHDEDRWAAELLAIILGGGMSSRLFLQVRERHGLAYSVRTSADSYVDAGSFATQAGVRSDKAELALQLILEEYNRIMQEPVPAAELNKAKQIVRGRMLLDLEESNAMAIFAGGQELLQHSILTPDAMWRHIKAVSADDVQRVAQRLLAPERRAMALLSPHRSTRAFEAQFA